MNYQDKLEFLEEKSNAAKELIGKKPAWITRWGLLGALVFILVLCFFSWVVKFPDMIIAPILLTSDHPPIKKIAESNGTIRLFVKNYSSVKQKQVLGIIESPSSPIDIEKLKEILKLLPARIQNLTYLKDLNFDEDLKLGELQETYSALIRVHREFVNYLNQNISAKEISFANDKIQTLQKLNHQQGKVKNLLEKDNKLATSNFERIEQLKIRNVSSTKELEDAERIMVNARTIKEESEMNTINTRLQIVELESKIKEIKIKDEEQRQLYLSKLSEIMKNLNSSITKWEYDHLIKSPIEGKVVFFDVWNDNQYISKGSDILTIIPFEKNKNFGRAKVPLNNSGKVNPGQKINIRLERYPYYEYGVLRGIVKSISDVPSPSGEYIAEVELPYGFKTSYGVSIENTTSLSGTAYIITDDLRLLERLFISLRKAVADVGIKKNNNSTAK